MSYSKDYHDYVFKNGKFVGDFDNMYLYAEEIPWKQDVISDSWFTEVGLIMLKDKAPYRHALEIGCGLGYISKKIANLAKNVDASDISSVSIEKAKSLHKGINFFVSDISEDSYIPSRKYDLVVVKDVLWYVCDKLHLVLSNISNCVVENGYLYLCQSFPNLDKNFVGKDVIPNHEILIGYLSQHFQTLYVMTTQRMQVIDDGPTLHYMGIKK